jgi:hypothetical protein
VELSAELLAAHAWRAMPHSLYRHISGGEYTTPKHTRLLSWLLMLNGQGRIRRLGISLPPGHSKSFTVDLSYPLWLLETNPKHRIILTSYSSTFAEEWGKQVRDISLAHADELSYQVRGGSRAAGSWRTTAGGGMWSVGAGGGLTGRRASCFIVDDILKNWDEAQNADHLDRTYDWFRSTVRSRLLPQGSMVVLMTRWAENDLIGKLM